MKGQGQSAEFFDFGAKKDRGTLPMNLDSTPQGWFLK
jgi:hypothetical protein